MKKRTKIAKGEIVYKYKRKYVLDIPKGAYIKKMVYDNEKNRTEIILTKHGILIEIVCSILICCMICIKLLNVTSVYKVYYDETPMCHNGLLYLNIKNDSFGDTPILIELVDMEEVILRKRLEKDEEILTIPIVDVSNEYILRVKSISNIGRVVEKVVRLEVDNYEISDMESESFVE